MNTRALLAVTVLTAAVAGPAHAQDTDAPAQEQQQANVRLPSIEAVMSMRERLALTDDQISRLDGLRAESVERRNADRAEMAEMQSRLSAGQIQRSEMMAFIEDRRAAMGDRRADHRASLEGVLDAEQLETLQDIGSRSRSFRGGRAGARAGRDRVRSLRAGVRAGRGSFRGSRGMRGARGAGIRSGRGFRDADRARWDRTARRFRGGR